MGGLHYAGTGQIPKQNKNRPFGGKTITIENLTPILSPKEQERRRREIEKRLFNVFSKYADKRRG